MLGLKAPCVMLGIELRLAKVRKMPSLLHCVFGCTGTLIYEEKVVYLSELSLPVCKFWAGPGQRKAP